MRRPLIIVTVTLLVITGVVLLGIQPAPVNAQTVTGTATASATLTPSATATPPLAPCNGSEQEPNDGGWGCVVAVGVALAGTLSTGEDVDWFIFYAKPGHVYRVEALPSAAGLDPALVISALNGTPLAANNDRAGGDLGASTDWRPTYEDYYLIAITNTTVITGAYVLRVTDVPATATPTLPPPTPTAPPPAATNPPAATAPSGVVYEPNDNWTDAQRNPLQWNQTVAEQITAGDVDWWMLLGKAGNTYRCAVTNANFDPQLRVEQDGQVVVANDDQAAGNPLPLVQWTQATTALVFPVVSSVWGTGNYQLRCDVAATTPTPAAPTPRPNGLLPTASVPIGTAAVLPAVSNGIPGQPTATPTPPTLTWALLGAVAQATPAITNLTVRVYYDLNGNNAPEPGEGVEGVSVRVLAAGAFVKWTRTNAQGEARLRIVGPVDRVSVPFLGLFTAVKPGETRTVEWRLPAVKLPTYLPVLEAQ